jgi:prefoldin subunit 5
MTNEEMQNTVQFILEQQAQLTVNVDKLGERIDKLGETVDMLATQVDKIAEAQIAHEKRTSRLEESFLILVQLAGNMDGRMDALTEAQSKTGEQLAETDKRLHALIETVDRYISDGRNGHPRK